MKGLLLPKPYLEFSGIGFFLESTAYPATPRSLLIAYLIRFMGFNLRELRPFLSESEAKWTGNRQGDTRKESQPLAIQAELPEWLMEKLHQFMTESAILALGSLISAKRAPRLACKYA